jgi:hypothetical protein
VPVLVLGGIGIIVLVKCCQRPRPAPPIPEIRSAIPPIVPEYEPVSEMPVIPVYRGRPAFGAQPIPGLINVGNFVLSTSLDPSGYVLPHVAFNIPRLGAGFQGIGFGQLLFHQNSPREVVCEVAWPNPTLNFDNGKLIIKTWVPQALNDILTTSFPVIFTEFDPHGIVFDFRFVQTTAVPPQVIMWYSTDLTHFVMVPEFSVSIAEKCIVAITVWHPDSFVNRGYKSAEHLIASVNWPDVRQATIAFETHFPRLRPEQRVLFGQEVSAAFMLTRTLVDGTVLTMGYRELNQRDSFWTSWMHLVLFREAEEIMITESCAHQRPDGKVPTCILPRINRSWDIDITSYFVLRICRYLHYWKDKNIVRPWVPHARLAIGYLITLLDDKKVPWARNFWADWKDVGGMQNRLYGPHFVLLVKAAFKEFNWLAKEFGEAPVDIQVNVEPLWNGKYYQDIMRDGSTDGRFHEDQMVGGLWNVCGEARFESMIATAEEFERPYKYGLPETLPFYSNSFGYSKGTYHNGGIWPWLSFADAASRIASGFRESGEKLLLKVAATDIVTFGDYAAHEYCHGIYGGPGGHSPQGWDAAAFLAFSLISDDPRNDLWRVVKEYR